MYNGIVIAASDMLKPAFQALGNKLHINMKSGGYHVFAILRTFLLVNIGRYFDRIENFGDCMQGFFNTLFNFDAAHFTDWFQVHSVSHMGQSLVLMAIACTIVFIVSFKRERGIDAMGRWLEVNVVVRILVYTVVGLLVAGSFYISNTGGGFLYANF